MAAQAVGSAVRTLTARALVHWSAQRTLRLRLAHRWRWLTDGQYQHVSAIVAEIGRLLGGWLRQEQRALGLAAPDKG